ncbi:MAG TPA: magnesium/cobalt transporter CorA, partial [Polyangiaceae bacterium LLY-WYZ-14_1]|nr:magnesium/cobalt transporter CorA [Polyangiaceae bacterium LLY-WYZ-14_1]
RARRGRVREKGADYLLYALVDAVVDWYFPLLEVMGERLEELEESALDYDPMGFADEVRAIRQDLMALRRTFWPLREALTAITETEIDAFERDTLVYFGDCRDHVVQALETVESYRETAAGLLDIQLSRSSHEIAEVTKVLTLMSTVFLPLTFITGLYGMNFDPDASPWNMPELEYRYGYPLALGAMLGVGLTMLLYFVRRGWLGGRRRRKGARPRRGRRRSTRSMAPPG